MTVRLKSLFPPLVSATILLVLGLPLGAMAYPSLVNTRYSLPELPASYSNYDCTDCHVSDVSGGSTDCNLDSSAQPWSPCFNAFGLEYRTSGWSTSLGNGDTDDDGSSNGVELSAAGQSAGFPQGAQSSSCDMAACATSAPAGIACSGNVQCSAVMATGPSSIGTNANGYTYSFDFVCAAGAGPQPSVSDTDWSDRCLDFNECLGNSCGAGTCTERSLVGWTPPGYDCACDPGYENTGLTCENVDECSLGLDDCGPNSACVDSVGGFQCVAAVPTLHPIAVAVVLSLIGSASYLTIRPRD